MRRISVMLSILITVLSLPSCGQDAETYWKIERIHREDDQPFIGMTGALMQDLFDRNFHFVKRNDSLHFELPEKFSLSLKGFKSLRQLHVEDRDYYEMYDAAFDGDNFLIKFVDNATNSSSKNTIMEFKRVGKEEYQKDVADELEYQKQVAQKISAFKNELAKNSPITLNSAEKLPTKKAIIYDDKFDYDIELQIPEEIDLWETGDLKNEVFGSIKIGSIKDNSRVYDLEHAQDYGLKQLTIWISSDSSAFDLEKYIADASDMVLIKQEDDRIVGYRVSYDFDEDKAILGSVFTLRYLRYNNSHLFIYGDVTSSDTQDASNLEEMSKILNFNYSLSENITLVE